MSNLTGFVKRLRDIMRNDAGINGDAQRIEQIAWMLFLKVYDAKEQDWEWDDENYQSILPEECRWQNWAHDDKSGNALTGDRLLDFVNNTLFPTLKNLPVTTSTPVKKAIVQTTFSDANQYMKDGVLLRQVINVIDELDLSDYEESHAFGEIYETILKELQSAGSAGEYYTPRAVTDFMAQMIKPKIGEKMADFACGTGGFITSWLKELDKQVKTTEDKEAYGASVYGMEKKQFPYMLCITNMLLHDLDVPQVFHGNSLLRDVLDYTEDDQFDVILMNPPYGGNEKADVKNHFPSDLASSETADLFMSVILYRLKKNGRAAVILPDGFLFGTDNAKVNIKKKLLGEFNLHTIVRMPGSVFAPYTSITTNILFFDNTHPTEETWFYRLDMPEGYKHFSKTRPMKLEHFQPVLDWWNDRREITEDGFDKAKKFTAEELAEDLGYNLDLCGYPHEEEEILAPIDLIQRYEEQRTSLNAEIDRVLDEITSLLGGNADEQRPEEGTAEELFAKIQEEKQRLISEKKIKKEKSLPEITEDEKPFDIPESWKWVRMGSIASKITDGEHKTPHRVDSYQGFYLLSARNIRDGYILLDDVDYVDEEEFEKISQRCNPKRGDVLISCSGSVGRCSTVEDDNLYVMVRSAAMIAPIFLNSKYLMYTVQSEVVQGQIRNKTKQTAQANLFQEAIRTLIIPLPPLAEQKRIVEKLEQLLPLCERLG